MSSTSDSRSGRFRPADSRAASPVVGVLLMVTLVVILSAITSGGAFGIWKQAAHNAPSVGFQAEWEVDGGNDVLVLRHDAGKGLDPARVTVSVDDQVVYTDGAPVSNPDLSVTDGWSGDEITSGEEIRFEETSEVFEKGDRLRIYYEVDDQSYVIFKEN